MNDVVPSSRSRLVLRCELQVFHGQLQESTTALFCRDLTFSKSDHEMERAPKVTAASEAFRQHAVAAAASLHTGTVDRDSLWSSGWLCSLVILS